MEHKILLSPEDLELIKAQVKAECMKELTGQDYHTKAKYDPFGDIRNKYAKNNGPLNVALGRGGTYYKAWECIRQLAVFAVGERYVRDLTPEKSVKAAEIAEFFCKYLIEKGVKPNA